MFAISIPARSVAACKNAELAHLSLTEDEISMTLKLGSQLGHGQPELVFRKSKICVDVRGKDGRRVRSMAQLRCSLIREANTPSDFVAVSTNTLPSHKEEY